ncbi:MAG: 1-acyl-sn-glycerol-3-phosphate acyltransferase [Lachnospiraceae bacterium]|nr:1-acyl-sn-glycerol-3-phosphate acyltransferase [Lachnospiraceae bacterium]
MPSKLDLLDKIRKLLHPILLKAMPGRRDFPIELLNSMPEVQGNKLFAINHSCVCDAPVSCESIKEHCYILVGKQSLELIDRIFFLLNGVIYVDRKNKENRKKSFDKMLKLLQSGKSIMIYPEGTWNMTPSKPMLPLNWGIIELSKQTGVPIIPLVLEYHTDCCYAKFGKPIYIEKDMEKKEGIEQLEETMATLKWDIWEMFPVEERKDDLEVEFAKMMEKRVDVYPKFNLEYEMSVVRNR